MLLILITSNPYSTVYLKDYRRTKHCATTTTLEKKVLLIWILLTKLVSLSNFHGEIYWKKGFKYRNLKRQKLILATNRVDINGVNGQISGPLLSQTISLTVFLKYGTDSSDSPGL